MGNFGEAHYQLGRYYKEKGPEKTAIFHFRRAMDLFAGNEVRQEEIRRLMKGLSADEPRKRERRKPYGFGFRGSSLGKAEGGVRSVN
jgi:hypothetical protein